MKLICPKCKAEIIYENINIETDLAKCDECKSFHKASKLIAGDVKKPENSDNLLRGSKIDINTSVDNSIELFFPKKDFSGSAMFILGFAIFWLFFISVWTLFAIRGSIIFAMFSIPFWLIGFFMLKSSINSIFETQTLKLTRNIFTIMKHRPFGTKRIEIPVNEIREIQMKTYTNNNIFKAFNNVSAMPKRPHYFGTEIKMPAVVYGVNTKYFFEKANNIEKEQVIRLLNNSLQKLKNKKQVKTYDKNNRFSKY